MVVVASREDSTHPPFAPTNTVEGQRQGEGGPCILRRIWMWARLRPNKRALVFVGETGEEKGHLTYSQLVGRSVRLSEHLVGTLGLEKGERVLLVFPSSLEFIVAFLACLHAGIIAVPVYPPEVNGAKKDFRMFSSIAASCGAKVALTCRSYNSLSQLATLRKTFTSLFAEGGRAGDQGSSWPVLDWVVTDGIGRAKEGGYQDCELPPPPTFAEYQVAFLQFTSGSTSEPKGVTVTCNGLSHNLSFITGALNADEDTIVVSWLPQYHDMGLIGSYLGTLFCGGSGIYMCPRTFIRKPILWPQLMSQYRATHAQAPNFAYGLAARRWSEVLSTLTTAARNELESRMDLSSLAHMINAAEPVDSSTVDHFYSIFSTYGLAPGVIFPTYGLAEHTLCVCTNGKGRIMADKEALETRNVLEHVEVCSKCECSDKILCLCSVCSLTTARELLSSGNLLEARNYGVDVIIVSKGDNGAASEVLPNGSVGEIWVRSSSVAKGYWNLGASSRETFNAVTYSDAGKPYLRTGDLGLIHGDELYVTGRLKDLIIIRGRNHYPQDIEKTAERAPVYDNDGGGGGGGGDSIQSSSRLLRLGTAAAFSIGASARTGADTESVALIVEVRSAEVPADQARLLAVSIRRAVAAEHGIELDCIALLAPRSVPKTTSGKIARAWCAKAFMDGRLKVIYSDSQQPSNGGRRSHVHQIEKSTNPEALEAILDEVCSVGKISRDEVSADQTLRALGLDSMQSLELLTRIEDRFCVKLPEDALLEEGMSIQALLPLVCGGSLAPRPRAYDCSAIARLETRDVNRGFHNEATDIERRRMNRAQKASLKAKLSTGTFSRGELETSIPDQHRRLGGRAWHFFWQLFAACCLYGSHWIICVTLLMLAALYSWLAAVLGVVSLAVTSLCARRCLASFPVRKTDSRIRLKLLQLFDLKIITSEDLEAGKGKVYIFWGDDLDFSTQILLAHSMPSTIGIHPRLTATSAGVHGGIVESLDPIRGGLKALSGGCNDAWSALARGESVMINESDNLTCSPAIALAASSDVQIVPCAVIGDTIGPPRGIIFGNPGAYSSLDEIRAATRALRSMHEASFRK